MGHICRVKYYFILFPVCLLFNYKHTYTQREAETERDTKTERVKEIQRQRQRESKRQVWLPHASNLKMEEVEAGGSWSLDQIEIRSKTSNINGN